jgi:surface protein
MNNLKKIALIFAFCLLNQIIKAQDEFIFIWQATNEEKRLDIPTNNNYVYNYTVNWGDGSVNNNVNGDTHHTYLNNGNYTVTITGVFPALNSKKIITADYKFTMVSIEQWGNNQWKTMEGAFYGLQNLVINTDDIPDLSQCTSLAEMFSYCFDINHGTHEKWNQWNVSTITDMNGMFASSNFNKAISNWNTSNVIDMSDMFAYNHDFNQSISTLGNSWNVSNVTDMERMFILTDFSQDITNWNVGNVTNMNQMFQGTESFQQQIGIWFVGNLLTMNHMFFNSNFNQPLNNWNVSKVTNMVGVFSGNLSFNQPLGNWDVANVTTMSGMFSGSNFNQALNNWNVGKVTSMFGMFQGTNSFNQPLNNWNVGMVNTMWDMFSGAKAFNQDISNWNTISVESMLSMFSNSLVFDQNIGSWNVANLSSCGFMFSGTKLNVANYEALLIGWNNQNLRANVSFDGGNSKYVSNAAEAARQNIIDNDNWVITDGGKLLTFTWTGAVSTDWNTAGNWDTNSVPTATDDVILADVANAPRVNFNQSHAVNDLTINENLTIKTNAGLTVNGNLDQGANIQVESYVTGNGSFILRGNQTNLNPADIIYLRYISGNNWHLFSSPATGIDIDVLAAATQLAEGQNNNRGIGFYDNNANPNWSYYQDGANDTGDFIAGKGYSLRTSANAFLILTGKLKATDLSNYIITENLNSWNLVGNPYPAFINANVNANANENFLTENADQLDPAFANIYLWNPSTTSYEPVGNGLGARYIAPGQGFFVKSKNGGGTIDINKTMLTHQIGDLFLKQNQPQKIVLTIDDKTSISETTIAFKESMTKGLDVTYDAAVFSGESRNLSLYTHLLEENEDVPFAIQFLPELENNEFVIPIGISQKENSEITFSLKETTISSDVKIYLEDKILETFTEISSNSDYTFFNDKGSSEIGRFYLYIQKNALSLENVQKDNINIYKDGVSSILINGVADGTLNIYSITGKNVIENRKINENEKRIQLPNLAKGIYLFEVKTNSRKIVKKIIF